MPRGDNMLDFIPVVSHVHINENKRSFTLVKKNRITAAKEGKYGLGR
jgi:hypothetical protein